MSSTSRQDRAPFNPARPPRRRSRGERARLVAAFVSGALAVLFAVLNLNPVPVDWIIGVRWTPLIVVILVSVLLGAVIGFTVSRRRG
jgi:uncharacterized integral membrane protein